MSLEGFASWLCINALINGISAFAFALAFEPPAAVSIPSKPAPADVGIESLWPLSIQRLTLALNWAPSLLYDPTLAILLIKSALRLGDHCRMNELETDELFDNVMHSALESALCTYVAQEHHKALRREFGTQEKDKRL